MKNYKKGLPAVGIAKGNRGFTLIELLVVIAIIGVLASVVLAATNSARTKGADAAVKANLGNARGQAELFYDTGKTYSGLCTSTNAGNINSFVTSAVTAGGVAPVSVAINAGGNTTSSVAKCNDSASAWAAESPLKSSGFWCVDSTGASKSNTTPGITSATDYTC